MQPTWKSLHMKFRSGLALCLITAISICGYSISFANSPERELTRYTLNKTEKFVRQLTSDVHREKRTFTQTEAEKLFRIAGTARHEATEASVALLSLGTPDQKTQALAQAYQIASTRTEAQRLYALLSLSYAKDSRWKSIAQSIPESDSGYECATALLNSCD